MYSPEGDAPSWWVRLKDEGHDVKVWIQKQSCKTIGNGLVVKAGSQAELTAWLKEGQRAGIPSLALFDFSGFGEIADSLRRAGVLTLCGGAFMDRLETDRAFGFEVMRAAGATLPPYQEFASIPEALKHAQTLGDTPTYFKSDKRLELDATHGADNGPEMAEYLEGLIKKFGRGGACILQQKIEGVPISTTRWWNGMDWVGCYAADYENKKFMNDNVGPATGCSFNVTWFYDDEPDIAKRLRWQGLTPIFQQNQAPPGLYDINAIISENGDAYFLEWTPRLGYDSEMTNAQLIPDLGRFLYDVATGHDPQDPSGDLAYSIRLSIPPYPWEKGEKYDNTLCAGLELKNVDGLWGGNFVAYEVELTEDEVLQTVGCEGIIGLVAACGSDIEACHEEAVEFAKEIKLSGASLMYRTDGADDCIEAAEKLDAACCDVHPGLM